MVDDLRFGRGTCCWKPRGCTRVDGCRLLQHPIKRAMLFNDPEAPCPKTWVDDDQPQTCALLNGHESACVSPEGRRAG